MIFFKQKCILIQALNYHDSSDLMQLTFSYLSYLLFLSTKYNYMHVVVVFFFLLWKQNAKLYMYIFMFVMCHMYNYVYLWYSKYTFEFRNMNNPWKVTSRKRNLMLVHRERRESTKTDKAGEKGLYLNLKTFYYVLTMELLILFIHRHSWCKSHDAILSIK